MEAAPGERVHAALKMLVVARTHVGLIDRVLLVLGENAGKGSAGLATNLA